MRVFSPLGQLINLLEVFTECNGGLPPAHVLLGDVACDRIKTEVNKGNMLPYSTGPRDLGGAEFVLNGVRCFKHPDVMPRNVIMMDGMIMGHIV